MNPNNEIKMPIIKERPKHNNGTPENDGWNALVTDSDNPANPDPETSFLNDLTNSGKAAQIGANTGENEGPGASDQPNGPEAKEQAETSPKNEPEEAGKPGTLGALLSGKNGINIIDALVPGLSAMIMRKVGYEIKPADLKLKQSEKDLIADPLQKAFDTVPVKFDSPWIALAATMVAVYGGKIMEKEGTITKIKKAPKVSSTKANETFKKFEKVSTEIPMPSVEEMTEQAAQEIKQAAASEKNLSHLSEQDKKNEVKVKAYMKDKKSNRQAALKYLKRRNMIPQDFN